MKNFIINKTVLLMALGLTVVLSLILYFSCAYGTYEAGDKLYSMGIANNTSGYWGYSEERYYERCGVGGWLAEDFADYLEVLQGDSFDIKSIWINNVGDVHPPLFYLLLHTLCFIFKGSHSKWICSILNIASFLVIAVILMLWICNIMSGGGEIEDLGMYACIGFNDDAWFLSHNAVC